MEIDTGWLTAGEAQARLGVNERTLRKWATAGKLRRARVPGGRVRFVAEDVERLAQELAARSQQQRRIGQDRQDEPDRAIGAAVAGDPIDPVDPVQQRSVEAGAATDAAAREQLLLQEIEWLRGQLERLHDTHREFCLLLLQSGRSPERATPNGHVVKAGVRGEG